MNLQTQSAFIAAIINLVLTYAVLLKGPDRPVNRSFAQLSFALFVWNLFFFLYKVTDFSIWLRLQFIGVVFLPASAFQFALSFIPERATWHRYFLMAAYIGGGLFLVTTPTSLFYSPWWNAAITVFIFPIVFLAGNLLYQRARLEQSIIRRRRLQFISLGGMAAALFGITDFLPGMGIPSPQLGNTALLIYIYAIAVGILNYHLLNIPEIIGKGITFLLQIFLLGGLLTIPAALSGYQLGTSVLISAFGATLFLLLFVEPLRMRFEEEVHRWFIKDYPAFQKRLGNYSNKIATAVSIKELETEVSRILEGFPGVKKARLITNVTPLLAKLLEGEGGAVFSGEEWTVLAEPELGEISSYNMFFPLRLHTTLYGAVAIQEQEGRDPYSNREMRALTVLANQLTSALVNLRAQEEIREKEKLAAVGELAAGLAHEIRNPLGSIKGAAQYLKPDRPVKESQEFLEIIQDEVNRLNLVVSEFLDYARPFKKDLTRTSLSDLIQKVLSGLKAAGTPPTIKIESLLKEDLPKIEIDPDQIRQVLLNLVCNAMDAMPQGGKLRISARLISEGEIEIRLSDTGVGIPPQNIMKLFQPFFTTKEKGTGLGLAISYRIVQGHGGSITAKSTLGSGSEFIIKLPLRQATKGD
ncbi:MAG: ATP-binding protein [Nitrospiria bacterium]